MVELNVLPLLEKQGRTKYWLYRQLNMSYQNFSRMIRNETKSIRYENIEILCQVLECTPNDLFVFVDDWFHGLFQLSGLTRKINKNPFGPPIFPWYPYKFPPGGILRLNSTGNCNTIVAANPVCYGVENAGRLWICRTMECPAVECPVTGAFCAGNAVFTIPVRAKFDKCRLWRVRRPSLFLLPGQAPGGKG